VETMSGLAFSCTAITFARRSSSFHISLGKLLSASGVCLVRFFSNEKTVTIGSDLDVLGKGCFRYCNSIQSVVFKPRSKPILIEAGSFCSCQQCSAGVFANVLNLRVYGSRAHQYWLQLKRKPFGGPSHSWRFVSPAQSKCFAPSVFLLSRSSEAGSNRKGSVWQM
jgi:uncharacterized protein YuzB (UPF0349 family)